MNGVLKYIHTKDITELRDLIRCAAVAVGESWCKKEGEKGPEKTYVEAADTGRYQFAQKTSRANREME